MKKAVVKTALAVLPNSIQYKALCKALNYLLPYDTCPFKKGTVLKLNVFDIKKAWLVECGESGYVKSDFPVEDVELRASFETLVECKQKSYIETSLNDGSILILGEQHLIDEATKLLLNLTQAKLDSLMEYFLVFMKIKKAKKVESKSIIQLSDLKTEHDIDQVRDRAINLEHTDLKLACELMELAHKARPNGPFIKEKLDSYRAKLNQN